MQKNDAFRLTYGVSVTEIRGRMDSWSCMMYSEISAEGERGESMERTFCEQALRSNRNYAARNCCEHGSVCGEMMRNLGMRIEICKE